MEISAITLYFYAKKRYTYILDNYNYPLGLEHTKGQKERAK